MRIKGQGTIVRTITRQLAERNRKAFSRLINTNPRALLKQVALSAETDVSLVSFSSSGDFPEQFLSILSFLQYAGRPRKWLLYSDGTHNNSQIKLLKNSFPFIEVVVPEWKKGQLSSHCIKKTLQKFIPQLLLYANYHALGKRLFLYLNYDIQSPTIFLDSDILFHKKAGEIKKLVCSETNGWFLPEKNWGCLDSRYIKTHEPEPYQANGGFIIANRNFEKVQDALGFLEALGNEYEYFTEQTIMHNLIQLNSFSVLDNKLFVLDNKDQFDFSDGFNTNNIALRHYTNPVRHKMWQKSWERHLSL